MAPYTIPTQVKSVGGSVPPINADDVLLACGNEAVKILQAAGLVHKNRIIHSLREKPIFYKGAKILISYDARITEREYHYLSDIQWDLQLAARLYFTGTTLPALGQYTLVESLHEVIEQIEALYEKTQKPVEVACDLETKGLDPYNWDAWIIACSFTVEAGKSTVLYFNKDEGPIVPKLGGDSYWSQLWEQINWILTTDHVSIRGANFKYDAAWIRKKWGFQCTNFKFDTVLVGSILNENRSNSLKLHAKVYTPMGGYEDDIKQYDMGALEKVPVKKLVTYVGGDTDATFQVACKLKEELKQDRQLLNFYANLLHPASRVFEKMEQLGIVVDLPYYKEFQHHLQYEIKQYHAKMEGFLSGYMRLKHEKYLKESRETGTSPMKPKILAEFLFTKEGLNLKHKVKTAKRGAPSTAQSHLNMFADNPKAAPFIKVFKDMTTASKMLSTFVTGFLEHLRSDGRFHPSYMLHRGAYEDKDSGVVTGRTSAKSPAIQTLPKKGPWAKPLRRAFTAPPGMSIMSSDIVQGELKISAILAREPTMLKAYQQGLDLHVLTAMRVNHLSQQQWDALDKEKRDDLRQRGKSGNFGLLYGMQVKGFVNYAWNYYGVKLTKDKAAEMRNAFFTTYPRLLAWHEECKRFAHQWGFVRSPLGRIRHLPLIHSKEWEVFAAAERMSINAPVQSALSDMILLSMAELERRYGNEFHPCAMIHDALLLYVPDTKIMKWAQRVKDVMENLPLHQFGWVPPLQFTVEIEVGKNLAELEKLNIV